jgi:hypothetical protein
MKITKNANGKFVLKISKKEWLKLGQGLTPNALEGKSLPQARKIVSNLLYENTKGFFSDQSWEGVRNVWAALEAQGIDVVVSTEGGGYQQDEQGRPSSKNWQFSIDFIDNKGRPKTLNGRLTAHGAGTVEDPLARYDISANVF